jgi:hypothetical protein
MFSGFQALAWETEGEGTVTVTSAAVSASIISYSPNDPNNPAIVMVGSSVTISVTFKNTGDTAWQFIAGATIWDSNGNIVADYEKTLTSALEPGQQTTISWTHTVNNVGDYWLQFGIWKEKPYTAENLLDKAPSPSQRLIVGFTPPIVGSFSVTIPQMGSGSPSISVYNPNTISITVTDFDVLDKGGFNGDITDTNLPLDIAAGSTGYVQLSVIDKGSSEGTYTIRFKLSGTP